MNSKEREIYDRYAYTELSYIFIVYIEFERRANHTEEEFEDLKPGECRFDYSSWCNRLVITKKRMEKAIKNLSTGDYAIKQVEQGKRGRQSKYFLTRYEEKKKEKNKENEKRRIKSVISMLPQDTGEQKEKKKEQKKEQSSIYNNLSIKSNDIYSDIFTHWNSKKIIEHRKITDPIKKAIDKALKLYSKDSIVQAIDNYHEIFVSNFYYKHKWTLDKFLNQSNGVPNFLDEGIIWINYKDKSNEVSNFSQKNNAISRKKPNKLLGWD